MQTNLISQQESWQEQFRDSLTSYTEAQFFFDLKEKLELDYEIRLPRSFAHKIKKAGPKSVLWKQFVPSHAEHNQTGFFDPTGDRVHAKGGGVIHRYKNRILFTPTLTCPIICRYCFRKNTLTEKDKIFSQNMGQLQKYLEEHPEINEVILTGGDPLILNNQKLELIIATLIQTRVKFFRIHTRTPIILPRRIDEGFIELLNIAVQNFLRVNLVIHTNHLDEIDHEVKNAFLKLKMTAIDLRTQSVLLKDINDNVQDLYLLFEALISLGATPYYLHHPDVVRGGMHFYISPKKGREIYLKLRNLLPGWALPHYVIDHPTGEGKRLIFESEMPDFTKNLPKLKAPLPPYQS